ncbi:hypothetical protein E2542_SST11194 [Spatholobus suberectus]|nr:hypothetical protein E2542_SST11194 [Spatholobus suberectus]
MRRRHNGASWRRFAKAICSGDARKLRTVGKRRTRVWDGGDSLLLLNFAGAWHLQIGNVVFLLANATLRHLDQRLLLIAALAVDPLPERLLFCPWVRQRTKMGRDTKAYQTI